MSCDLCHGANGHCSDRAIGLGWSCVFRLAYSHALLICCLVVASACEGKAGGGATGTAGAAGLGGAGGGGGAGGSVVPPPPGPGPQAIAACTPAMQTQVGPTPLRRISRGEYRKAVRAVCAPTTVRTAA